VYGRFDLRYDGKRPPVLLEYNADTPTTLLEAAILQWHWKTAVFPDDDQWNSLHERLVERWQAIRLRLADAEVHFTWSSADMTGEDNVTLAYMQECAAEAGLHTVALAIEQLGYDSDLDRFVDLEEAPISSVFKLYPWEWVLDDEFGRRAVDLLPETMWVEPLWKTLLSNKTILAVLWEMYPGHPNLLPAYLDEPHELVDYLRKPKLGREGSNITVAVRVRPGVEGDPRCVHVHARTYLDVADPDDKLGGIDYLRLNKTRAKRYAFDVVLGEECDQQEVFASTAARLIQPTLEGYNGTCFAYGATGAGKTHTMMGSLANPGVVPLAAVAALLAAGPLLRRKHEGWAFVMTGIAIAFSTTARLKSSGAPR
jgi:hypothetical protein